MNLEDLCQKVGVIAREAGNFIRNERIRSGAMEFQTKGLHDFVTDVDRQSESFIIEKLQEMLPDSGFIAEEGTKTHKGPRYNWIIDPLDGTTNFIHGLFPYSVSIALLEDEELQLGSIYEIGADELYCAWKSGGAWCNGVQIQVSHAQALKDSLIATGFPFTNFDHMEAFMNVIRKIMQTTHGIRRFGSAAVDLAYLASGKFDGFFEYNLNAWDVAAGIVIVKEAGGRITDFSGGENYLYGKEIVASNSTIHDEFLQPVRLVLSSED